LIQTFSHPLVRPLTAPSNTSAPSPLPAMVDKTTLGILSALVIGVVIFIAVLLVFELCRRISPSTFYYREEAANLKQWEDYDGAPIHALPRPSPSFFSWIKPVLDYTEDQLIKTHGLDAALYVRFLRMQTFMFSILAVFGLVFLIPFYSTAGNRYLAPDNPERADSIAILSLANVPQNNWRLWITLLGEFLVIGLCCYLIRSELYVYLRRRLEYRSNSVRNPSNYAVLVLDVPKDSQSKEAIRDFFNRCFPGEIAEVHHVRDGAKLDKLKLNIVKAMKARECAAFNLMRADFLKPDSGGHPKLEQKLEKVTEKQKELEEQRHEMMNNINDSAPYTSAAIVVFNNKRTAMLAASAPLFEKASKWRVERAAEPRAVNWNCLNITNRTAFIRFAIVTSALVALTILWVIPIVFLQGLANFDTLAKFAPFQFLADAKNGQNDTLKFVLKLIEGLLPPLVLTIFLAIVPMIFRAAIGQERIGCLGRFESKVRTGVFAFYCVSNFFFVVLSGSILMELKAIAANPSAIIGILATTVPSQAAFIMTYIILISFQGSPVALLNLGRLIARPIMLKIFPNTDRVKRDVAAMGFEFQYFRYYALGQMVSFIAIIYSTISPLICTVATIYFALGYLTKSLAYLVSRKRRLNRSSL